MKALKYILAGTYVAIIILLLLNMQQCSNRKEEPQEEPKEELKEEPKEEPKEEEIIRARTIGNSGELKITLLWDFYADIDLHVLQPNGNRIYHMAKQDLQTGGALDVDNIVGGSGSAENIYWSQPSKGNYEVSLHFFDEDPLETGECTVIVFQEGMEPKTYKTEMRTIKEYKHIVTIHVD